MRAAAWRRGRRGIGYLVSIAKILSAAKMARFSVAAAFHRLAEGRGMDVRRQTMVSFRA